MITADDVALVGMLAGAGLYFVDLGGLVPTGQFGLLVFLSAAVGYVMFPIELNESNLR